MEQFSFQPTCESFQQNTSLQIQSKQISSSIQRLECQFKNQSQLICCSDECKCYAPVCSKKTCKCRKQKHKFCQLIFAESLIEKILKKRAKPSKQVQNAINLIDKIYTDTIDQLSIEREALLNWRDNYGLSTDDIHFLTILKQDRRDQLSGEFINKIKSNINKKCHLKLSQKQVSRIWSEEKNNLAETFSRINYSFKPISVKSFKIDNSIVQVKLSNNGNEIQISEKSNDDEEIKNIRQLLLMEQSNLYRSEQSGREPSIQRQQKGSTVYGNNINVNLNGGNGNSNRKKKHNKRNIK